MILADDPRPRADRMGRLEVARRGGEKLWIEVAAAEDDAAQKAVFLFLVDNPPENELA